MNNVDLSFIGSGISTSFTILAMLDELDEVEDFPKSIAIIERSSEFHTGLAYGPSSGASALLITSLNDFLPEGEVRNDFLKWLYKNVDELIEELLEDGDQLSANWVTTHKVDIENKNYGDVYLPRRFFGKYIHDRLNKAIKHAKNRYDIEFVFFQKEVKTVTKNESGFNVIFDDDSQLTSKEAVLSIGIPPLKSLWTDERQKELNEELCLIDNPYVESLAKNLDIIQEFANAKQKKSNVLVVGSNASAMEMIYKINDVSAIARKIEHIYVMSPQGELPNSAQTEETRAITFVPTNLNALKNKKQITALEIYEAVNKDLDEADKLEYGAAISEVPVSKGFTSLLSKLDDEQLVEFACFYGNAIGKRQRRAGGHYTAVVEQLQSKNKLTNVKGYFQKVNHLDKHGSHILYKTIDTKEEVLLNEPINVILNCIGGRSLNSTSVGPLLDNLLKNSLIKANKSQRGVVVNNQFSTPSGMFVAGPLLSGNVINKMPLWHIEHCGRIIFLSKLLAKQILKKYNSSIN